ncbi:hypothetical protein CYMTET_43931, partial [Cymbomonas tetramitiformis]
PNLAAQGRAISMGSTSMSSQYAGSAAVNAIESDWKRTGLLAHTSGGAGETSPWWQVELTQSFQIGTVLILNDVGECGSRFLKGWQCNGTLDGESFFGPGEGAVVGVSDRPCVGDICSGTACGSIHIPSLTDWYSIDCGVTCIRLPRVPSSTSTATFPATPSSVFTATFPSFSATSYSLFTTAAFAFITTALSFITASFSFITTSFSFITASFSRNTTTFTLNTTSSFSFYIPPAISRAFPSCQFTSTYL